ncbi:MAG: glycosyltransferase family 4 protein [Bacteroidales bacterium]|nr:glycosyltransferase family 4 protein [Bacteroidales bacterium]
MKILQTCRSLGAGGIEAIVCALSNEMAKTESVTVCTLKKPSPDDLFYKRLSPGIKKRSINQSDKDSPLSTVFHVWKFIRRGNFDVVSIHGFFYFYLLAVLLLHRKTRFYYTVHSDALKENNPWDLRLLKIKKWCFRQGWVRPITISLASKESFTHLYQCESKLIPNGIPRPVISSEPSLERYKITPNTHLFFHAGRICPEKNQSMLCRVFDRLIREGKDIAFIIAGPCHVEASYQEIVPYLSERIHYIGEQSDIPSLMYTADAFCLASHYEGMPVVLLESFAVGCPAICTPVGGISNMIENGKNGILSKDLTEQSYYDAVSRFLVMSLQEKAVLKKDVLNSFNQYTIETTAKAYLSYYQK